MLRHVEFRSPWSCPPVRVERAIKPALTPADTWHRLAEENRALCYWCLEKKFGKRSDWQGLEEWESEALEALVRAARSYNPDFRGPSGRPVKFCTYAVWVIRNALKRLQDKLNTYRKRYRLHTSQTSKYTLSQEDSQLGDLMSAGPDPQAGRVWAAIDSLRLPPRHKQAFVLHFAHDMNYREVGRSLGVTGERARQLVNRVKRQIQERLG